MFSLSLRFVLTINPNPNWIKKPVKPVSWCNPAQQAQWKSLFVYVRSRTFFARSTPRKIKRRKTIVRYCARVLFAMNHVLIVRFIPEMRNLGITITHVKRNLGVNYYGHVLKLALT